MHLALHVLLRANHSKFKVDAGQDFTDATHLVEPVAANLPHLVWDLSEVSCVFILVSD